MNDFTILHLSDLHINSSGKTLSLLLENLLKDIENEMELSENILIVVTGDIIDQANYDNYENAVEFFRKLKSILDDKVRHIYIVPGNHDKVRNFMDRKILSEYTGNEDYFYSKIWKYLRMGFDDYTEMLKRIYKIFYSTEEVEQRIFEDAFGVNIDKINGKNICVIQLNTAWSCVGGTDERNLRLGAFQIKKVKEIYEKKKAEKKSKGEEIALTIALAHHPVSWLQGKDEDILQAEMLSNVGLNTDIYICGHVHNRDVIDWQNNRHSLTTLVSGIGWPDGSTSHPEAHNYSSYVFNLDINSIDVYARSSNDALKFEPDFRIYTQERNKKDNKIIMPIDSCKTQAYFNLSTVEGRSAKGCYITDELISHMERAVRIFEGVRNDMQERLAIIKYDIFDNIILDSLSEKKSLNDHWLWELEDFWFRGGKRKREINKVANRYSYLIYMQFSTYLQYLCRCLYENIVKYLPGSNVRTHFRYLNINEDRYYQNCIFGVDFENYIMKPKKYGELIEKAFESKRPLIASVNSIYCKQSMEANKKKENDQRKWVDFITVIPEEYNNYYIKKNEKTGNKIKERPILTFGITVYEEQDQNLLYIFDYLRIDKMLGELLHNFLYYIPVNLLKYVNRMAGKAGMYDNNRK